jgi:uncharacterized membrane protein YkoI
LSVRATNAILCAETEEATVNRKTTLISMGVAAAVAVGGGASIAAATGGGDDNDAPITGAALDKASTAALEETGGGRVTETEVGDEEGYYEVEVTLDDGSQVDVHLDRDFNVINSGADHEDREGSGNDDD